MYTDVYYFSRVLGQSTTGKRMHGNEYLLIDRMVELRYALMSPVFTQLWENLSQGIRPGKRVETETDIRNQHIRLNIFHICCQ